MSRPCTSKLAPARWDVRHGHALVDEGGAEGGAGGRGQSVPEGEGEGVVDVGALVARASGWRPLREQWSGQHGGRRAQWE
jgi:hypothetical protein